MATHLDKLVPMAEEHLLTSSCRSSLLLEFQVSLSHGSSIAVPNKPQLAYSVLVEKSTSCTQL